MPWKIAAAIAAAVSAAVLVAAPGGWAAGRVLDCHGTDEISYTPAVTATPRPVTLSMRGVYVCRSAVSGLTGGTLTVAGGGTLGCRAGSFTGTITARWDNGQQSTMSGGDTVALRADSGVVVVGSGRVTGGLFAGARVSRTVVSEYAGPGCAAAGVSAARALTTLSITPA